MIEIKGDMWKQCADAICITTNGFVKKDGRAVMGRGCAKEALEKMPNLDINLGHHLKAHGNVPNILTYFANNTYQTAVAIISFPVKPQYVFYNGENVVAYKMRSFNLGDQVPGWAARADLDLIKHSCLKLLELTMFTGFSKIILPRPGCGAGELSWPEVKEVIEPILDDRFYIISK